MISINRFAIILLQTDAERGRERVRERVAPFGKAGLRVHVPFGTYWKHSQSLKNNTG